MPLRFKDDVAGEAVPLLDEDSALAEDLRLRGEGIGVNGESPDLAAVLLVVLLPDIVGVSSYVY